MNRLSERDENGNVVLYTDLFQEKGAVRYALNKLADYEDAEGNGMLVRLPFSEDAELYVIDDKIIKEGRRNVDKEYVVKGEIDRFYFVDGVVSFDVVLDNSEGTYLSLTSEDIGKTVFLTREEAEKALKEGD